MRWALTDCTCRAEDDRCTSQGTQSKQAGWGLQSKRPDDGSLEVPVAIFQATAGRKLEELSQKLQLFLEGFWVGEVVVTRRRS